MGECLKHFVIIMKTTMSEQDYAVFEYFFFPSVILLTLK